MYLQTNLCVATGEFDYQLMLCWLEDIVQKVQTILNLREKVEAPFAVVAGRNV